MLLASTTPRTSLGTLYSDVDVAALRAWLMAAGPGAAALATAPTGSGLSTLVRLLVKEVGLDAVWVCSGTPRVRALLHAAGANPVSVVLRRAIIVVDEIDGMAATGDTGLADALAFVKTKPPVPMLFLGKACRSVKPMEFAKAWPKFAFARPPPSRVAAYLRGVAAAHGVPLDAPAIDALAAQAKGDVRSAIMAMDFARSHQRSHQPATPHQPLAGGQASLLAFFKPAPRVTVDVKDDADDGLDLVEAVLRGDRGRTVADALAVFSMEPGMVPMGVFENYAAATHDIHVAARIADEFSAADTVDRYMYAKQAWDLHDAYGALALAAPAMAMHHHPAAAQGRRPAPKKPKRSAVAVKPPAPTIHVTKFGSVWSKSYNMCAKQKNLKAIALKYAEAALVPMGPCDLAFVRLCIREALSAAAASPEDVRRLCWPLTAAEVLGLARLDVAGSGWYKQSTHAWLKKTLSAAHQPSTTSAMRAATVSGGSVPSTRTTGTSA